MLIPGLGFKKSNMHVGHMNLQYNFSSMADFLMVVDTEALYTTDPPHLQEASENV